MVSGGRGGEIRGLWLPIEVHIVSNRKHKHKNQQTPGIGAFAQ